MATNLLRIKPEQGYERVMVFLKLAATRTTLIRGMKLALVVGIILNFINQGEFIIKGAFGEMHWPKFFLTFCVPFCVSVYSVTAARMRFDPNSRAEVAVDLGCVSCGKQVAAIAEGELIPNCPHCLEKTKWRATNIA